MSPIRLEIFFVFMIKRKVENHINLCYFIEEKGPSNKINVNIKRIIGYINSPLCKFQ